MAGTVVADTIQAAATSTLLIQTGNGVPTTAISIDPTQKVTLPVGIDGNLKFNSGYGSIATAYGCRAWVNFNGTTNVGGFCTIRASGNVSSVADNGAGDYTVNFTNALPDANYAAVVTNVGLAASDTRRNSVIAGAEATGATTMSTTAIRVNVGNPASASLSDNAVMNVAIFR
jgi:hypothetical protein